MDSKKSIGLVFSYNEDWIAGAYYILNIIHALNKLEEKDKPIITILSDNINNFNIVKEETDYPYLDYSVYPFKEANFNLIEKILNKLSTFFLKRKVIDKRKNIPKLDFVYPRSLYLISDSLKKINWVPDFQEDYLPHLFSKEEIMKRKKFQKEIVAQGDIVVLSSKDAKDDFVRLYPNSKAKPYVLNFAVTHPDFSNQNIEKLKVKHGLNSHYFFAPNQFWAHKNHIVILKAVKLLKDKGLEVVVAMSGKNSDYRNKDNFKRLENYIKFNSLESNIKLLGFLPRQEQLCLFKNAIGVIQPSLFEGWSTVVEDAKKLNKILILSNLKVHKEQVKENGFFFNPSDFNDLADKIEMLVKNQPKAVIIDYEENVINFGKDFLRLIDLSINKTFFNYNKVYHRNVNIHNNNKLQ
jgi:glycosyltransferase involved in cell wall biosynthesis